MAYTHSKRSNLNYFAIDLKSLSYSDPFKFPIHGDKCSSASASIRNGGMLTIYISIWGTLHSFVGELNESDRGGATHFPCAAQRNCVSDPIFNCNDKLLTMLMTLTLSKLSFTVLIAGGFETPFLFRLHLFWLPPSRAFAIYMVDSISQAPAWKSWIILKSFVEFKNAFSLRFDNDVYWVAKEREVRLHLALWSYTCVFYTRACIRHRIYSL